MSAQMSAILRQDITEDEECELSVERGVNLKCNKRPGKSFQERSGSEGG